MANALDVARQLVHLAGSEDEPDFLCHLRLQKLLYYVQGWSLGIRKKAMFPDRIEAWANGPVVKSVYPKFADYGFSSISPDTVPLPKKLTAEEAEFVARVWETYKVFSASSLREMTHAEVPWLEARGDTLPGIRSDAEITHESLAAFFQAKAA